MGLDEFDQPGPKLLCGAIVREVHGHELLRQRLFVQAPGHPDGEVTVVGDVGLLQLQERGISLLPLRSPRGRRGALRLLKRPNQEGDPGQGEDHEGQNGQHVSLKDGRHHEGREDQGGDAQELAVEGLDGQGYDQSADAPDQGQDHDQRPALSGHATLPHTDRTRTACRSAPEGGQNSQDAGNDQENHHVSYLHLLTSAYMIRQCFLRRVARLLKSRHGVEPRFCPFRARSGSKPFGVPDPKGFHVRRDDLGLPAVRVVAPGAAHLLKQGGAALRRRTLRCRHQRAEHAQEDQNQDDHDDHAGGWSALYNALGIEEPKGNNLTRYYALIDIKKLAEQKKGKGDGPNVQKPST